MGALDIQKRLDPQMAAALAKQVELVNDERPVAELPVVEARVLYRDGRRFWNADRPEVARVRGDTVPGPVGSIPLRYYYPIEGAAALPALLYLHGGGWLVGDLDTHDKIMRLLALASGAVVVGVDYRLAPEHKFPVALEESLAVVRHLARHGADSGIDPGRLAIGGDSAGAAIAISTCLGLKQREPGLLRAALLYYGAYGLHDSASQRKYGGSEDGLSREDMAYYRACLVRTPADLDDPRLDVLSADLGGLPPLFIAAAELDPLFDDSAVLAEIVAEAGGEPEYRVYRGVLHGFLHMSRMVDAANNALNDGADWLRAKLR